MITQNQVAPADGSDSSLSSGSPAPDEAPFRDWPEVGRIYFAGELTEGIDILRQEILQDESYLRHGIELKPGDVVFDAGAHVGVFAIHVSQKCNNDVSVFCFEPIPQTFSCLERNLSNRGLLQSGQVKVFNTGLTSNSGPAEAEFVYFENASILSTMNGEIAADTFDLYRRHLNLATALRLARRERPIVFPLIWTALTVFWPITCRVMRRKLAAASQEQRVQCGLTTISKIIEQHKVEQIDLLKIDVEGAEWDVLNGIAEADWQRIRQLVIEVHDIDHRADRIQELLQRQKFSKVVCEQPLWDVEELTKVTMLYASR